MKLFRLIIPTTQHLLAIFVLPEYMSSFNKIKKATVAAAIMHVLSRVDVRLCLQQHIIYNSLTRSKSREKEMEKKDTDGMQGRSKEKKEEKDRKDRKRVSV